MDLINEIEMRGICVNYYTKKMGPLVKTSPSEITDIFPTLVAILTEMFYLRMICPNRTFHKLCMIGLNSSRIGTIDAS